MTSLVSLVRAGRVFDALKTRACVSRISLDGEGSDHPCTEFNLLTNTAVGASLLESSQLYM